ncbi:hypothetical protein WEB32_03325 [Streptomyces netropsis]|uniref:Uncharacterized protein n=1 Tax=Streptomyces netropsis TaxID=55404 RepID=A0A7W7LBJ8_STRNE|nr:hypothetical protein [Streptomyces netropsis]MBB4887205.1 hypothetical protein [Streptomyces netropsis]GGR08636.1 hypothetical protein GCM10010219_11290 [Streptomyces netropsis]
MTSLKRAAATLAATLLLTVGSAAMAAPANAAVHIHLLGLVGADSNGTIDLTGPGGEVVVSAPNLLSPIV